MTGPFGPAAFAQACADAGIPVSRETLGKLERYAALLADANARMNLVSAASLPDLWRRHFLDSAQLVPLLPPEARSIVDLGSGAGFPGLVVAVLRSSVPGTVVHLIDSTQKKARFLSEVGDALGAPVVVHPARIDRVPAFAADAVTARACAPLPDLLALAHRFTAPHSVALFLKGQQLAAELTAAAQTWQIAATTHHSLSDPSGRVLRVTRFRRVTHSKRPTA